MPRPTPVLIVAILLACAIGCVADAPLTDQDPESSAEIVVTTDATYSFESRDVVYAQGQQSLVWNGPSPSIVNLEATLWEPVGATGVRPALLIIHGGGFVLSDRNQAELVRFAEFFSSRGYVVMSATYRTRGQHPTMPSRWSEAIESSDAGLLEQEAARTMYGATRDAKAAVRYLQANAAELNIDPDRIAAMGASAGSFISLALGATEPGDFRDELVGEDPTLETTHLDQTGAIVAVLDHWGGPEVLSVFELAYSTSRWGADDAPVQIVHGTDDLTVPVASAEKLRDIYETNGVAHDFHLLEGAGHSAWNETIEGKSLELLGFDFLVQHQGLTVE